MQLSDFDQVKDYVEALRNAEKACDLIHNGGEVNLMPGQTRVRIDCISSVQNGSVHRKSGALFQNMVKDMLQAYCVEIGERLSNLGVRMDSPPLPPKIESAPELLADSAEGRYED